MADRRRTRQTRPGQSRPRESWQTAETEPVARPPRERATPAAVGPSRRDRARAARAARARRTRLRLAVALGLVLIGTLVVATAYLKTGWLHPVYDYTGEGNQDVLIEVHQGDTAAAIGETLQQAGVVATVGSFVDASYGNAKMAAIQPGFYQVRTHIPSAAAVAQLTDPDHRMGLVLIPEGSQLDDTTYIGNGKVTPGIFSRISEATRVDLNGQHHQVDATALRAAAGGAPLAELAVPDWALGPATRLTGELGADRHRRLEGLIAPGTWSVDPLASPTQILATLIKVSAARYDESGLRTKAATLQTTPYQVLVVASLVQKEAEPDDYAKVARVIYNRLDTDAEMLQFDSTVNYPLERREVATSDDDRHRETPWNTYVIIGLPLTPICSPDEAALTAAEQPEPGDWLYFVTVDKNGTTLFTNDYQEHLANIEQAQQNGVLESNR